MQICLSGECERDGDGGRGYCGGHYQQLRKGKPLTPLNPRQSNKGKTCSGPECDRPAESVGMCSMHRMQAFRGRELTVIGQASRGPARKYDGVECKFDGCDRQPISLGMCNAHHQQFRRGVALHPIGWKPPKAVATCKDDDCEETSTRRRWCDTHYRRFMRTGSANRTKGIRAVDGRRIDTSGYVSIKRPGHPEAKDSGWGAEHRIVMSDLLGRALYPDENIHHRDGVKHNNDLANLELWSTRQPPGQRVSDKLAWARELIARYADVPEQVIAASPVRPQPPPATPSETEAEAEAVLF